jgi:Tol biopolymer transport system component
LPSATPASIRKLIRRCLTKDRRQRLQAIGEARIIIADPAASDEPVARPGGGRFPWVIGAAVASIIALISAFGWWRVSRPPAPAPMMNINFDLGPEAALDRARPMSLSADGRRMVYVSRRADGKTQLSMRVLDQRAATVLPDTEGAEAPFFSPDGQWVGFVADGRLRKISTSGARAITLCDAPAFRGASWGENGVIVAALQSAGTLSLVKENGGEPTPFLPFSSGVRQRGPQVLPGGKTVIFSDSVSGADWDNGTIQAVSFKELKPKVLIKGGYFGRFVPTGNASGGHLVYMSHGTLWAVPFDPDRLEISGTAAPLLDDVAGNSGGGEASLDFSRTGVFAYVSGTDAPVPRTLAWLDGSGRVEQLIALTAGRTAPSEPRIAPDGKRFAFRSRDAIWMYDLERNTQSRLSLFEPSIFSLVFTPDGSRIAFESDVDGKQGIWWVRTDGKGEPEQLTKNNNAQHPTSFSRDGKWMALTERNAETGSDVWLMPIDWTDAEKPRAGKAEPLLHTKSDEDSAVFSPDGRWLAYSSNESGKVEVFVKSVTGAGKWPIATGSLPVWSRSSRELFWQGPRPDSNLMVAGYSTKSDTFIADKPRVWSDKQRIVVPNKQDFDLALDATRIIVVLDPRQQETSSSEGTSGPAAPTHVNLLLNFFDEMKRRAPERK